MDKEPSPKLDITSPELKAALADVEFSFNRCDRAIAAGLTPYFAAADLVAKAMKLQLLILCLPPTQTPPPTIAS